VFGSSWCWSSVDVSGVAVGVPVYGCRVVHCGLASVECLAADLVACIRGIQPRGPYRIAGFSGSYLIAHEACIQLLGVDVDVQFLGAVEVGGGSPLPPDVLAAFDDNSVVDVGGYEILPSPIVLHLITTSDLPDDTILRGWGPLFPAERRRRVRPPHSPGATPSKLAIAGLNLALAQAETIGLRSPTAELSYSAGVTIQHGTAGSDPLFCIPGAGASVTDFLALAADLGDQQRLVGFQPRGTDSSLVPHSSVAAAASAYLSDLQSIHPTGPVRLLGHSFGGWVAFELALRLQSLHREIISVTLLDTTCPGSSSSTLPRYSRLAALMELVALYELTVGHSLDLPIDVLQSLSHDGQLTLIHKRLVAAKLLPARSVPSSLRGAVRCFATALRTAYAPTQTLRTRVQLVLVPTVQETPDAAASRFAHDIACWRTLAPDLEAIFGTGNHITLLNPPHIAAWSHCVLSRQRTDVAP
jgi:thioesterase domain-containing protein